MTAQKQIINTSAHMPSHGGLHDISRPILPQ